MKQVPPRVSNASFCGGRGVITPQAPREVDVQQPRQNATEVTHEACVGVNQVDEQQLHPAHQLLAAQCRQDGRKASCLCVA